MKTMWKRLQKETRERAAFVLRLLASETAGQELAEAALIVPIVLMLLIGTIWMGRAFNIYQTVCRAAREGAEAAVAPSCATCGDARPSTAQVRTVVDNVLASASIDATNATITVKRNQPVNPSSPAYYQVSGVQVTVSYPVQLTIPFTTLNATTVTVSTTAEMLQEF